MNTEQRVEVRRALINQGFRRYYAPEDEQRERIISAALNVDPNERREGAYTELFKHPDGTIVSVSWAKKSHIPWRNC
jgi:hypothetical protein